MICSNASSTCTDPKVCSGSGHIQPISSFFHKNPRVRLHIRTSPFPPAYWVTMGEGHTGGDPAAARNPCSLNILSQNRELTGWGGQREEVQWDSSPSHSPRLSSPCQPRETHKSSNLIPLDLLMLKKQKQKNRALLTAWRDSWHERMFLKKKWQCGNLTLCERRGRGREASSTTWTTVLSALT